MTIQAVPSRPLREWLTAWMITTGDPPETIAKGFALDATFVAELLGAEPPRMLDVVVARDLCIKLWLDPAEVWRPETARHLGRCDWPVDSTISEMPRAVLGLPMGVRERSFDRAPQRR